MNIELNKTKDSLPDFGRRVFFLDSQYKGGMVKEYLPEERIELKKGKFIEMKDCEFVKKYLIENFDYWFYLPTFEK